RADLTDADLTRADLTGAVLTRADLTGAVLTEANVIAGAVIPDIDAPILRAIEAGGELDMGSWHVCETTHCRAGWAVHLTGEKGRALERKLGPAGAGAFIYWRSTGRVPNFYATDEDALADIVACAYD